MALRADSACKVARENHTMCEPQAHANSGLVRTRVGLVTFIQTPVPSCTDTFISFQLL